MRLVEQTEPCGPGEPYDPIDVDLLFGERTVALRGPWNPVDLVKIGPTAADLADLYEYHLDFPGHALEPDCDYERWATRLGQSRVPTAYGHVATEPSRPGLLALQHEGAEQADWDDEKLRAPGRAPGGVLQRPDRAEHETAVDRADQLVRELAALIRLLRSPELVLLLIGVLLAIVIFAIERAT